MNLNSLSEAQFICYFERRLADKRFRRSGAQYKALCPFHPDDTPSLSVNPAKGGSWYCHGCGKSGGVLEFERLFSNVDDQTAIANIAELVGEKQLFFRKPPDRVHVYQEAGGVDVFRVLRIGSGKGKRIWQEIPDGKGGWLKEGAQQHARVLYKLPQVITARTILFVEGEKCADDVCTVLERAGQLGSAAATTSPLGAGKYRDEYSPYFAGRQLFIFPDNDDAGRKHALQVATSAFRYAHNVKIVELPGLPEKGDVSDFLQDHSFDELLAATKAAPLWQPEAATFALAYDQFQASAPDHIHWLIEGLIQRGSNGMLIARPKGGKSFAFLDMAVALASGQPWLDFYVPQRAKVLFVSREDNPDTTKDRGKKLCAGRDLEPKDLASWLWINSREQTKQLMLNDSSQVAEIITTARQVQADLIMLDVLRVLHANDENDNQQMQEIIEVLNHIRDDTGAAIAVAHHARKGSDGDTLTDMARGAGALAGWTEWLGCIRVVDETRCIRHFKAEIKAANIPEPLHWKIVTTDGSPPGLKLERVQYDDPMIRRRNTRSTVAFDPEEV